jgi:tetratricopeptide (TPR) repeat protein
MVMPASERYMRLTALAQRAFSRGQLHRSLRLFEAAEEESKRTGDRELQDRAFCNRCVVLAELDRLSLVAGELRHILMRSRDPFTGWMAAYYTSQAYAAEDNLPRALAYARRATELAQSTGQPKAQAVAANWHGALALKQSEFDEAAESFRTALQLDQAGEGDPLGSAITKDNLGYCLMCRGEAEAGLALCLEAAATLEGLGARQYLPEVYQDICYGFLCTNSLTKALGWGRRALQLAAEYQHPQVERNTLMLLVDAAVDAGEESLVEEFLQLLTKHYPDAAGMRTFFQAFNVRDVINLKA